MRKKEKINNNNKLKTIRNLAIRKRKLPNSSCSKSSERSSTSDAIRADQHQFWAQTKASNIFGVR